MNNCLSNTTFETPVVLITFNRPKLVIRQIERLRAVRPQKLFFVSDGARENKENEKELVHQTRQLIDLIDWPCDVEKIFAENNMGCDRRVVSALNEVFSKVDKAIILEDDCLPCVSFFAFCEELLKKYESNQEIMYISGSKWVPEYKMEYSYGFSYNTGTWGWATWSRAWKEWHWSKEEWDANKEKWLEGIYSKRFVRSWIADMEKYFLTDSIPWDYVWRFCIGRRLSIFPAVNLITNIGFGEDATHTKEEEYGYDGRTYEMDIIVHPPTILADLNYPKAIEQNSRVPFMFRVKRKMKKIFSSLVKKR